jgi:hypothetical protein
MRHRRLLITTSTLASIALGTGVVAQKASPSLQMGGKKSVTRFFITSRGLGRGGNLGGLAGADVHCQALAKKEGSADHTWRAYLSTMATTNNTPPSTRDRIGKGPWYNALGDRIALKRRAASQREERHQPRERRDLNAVILSLEVHDILTGSRPDGTAFPGTGDLTRSNWTIDAGDAQVGHHDLDGAWGQYRARAILEFRARLARMQSEGFEATGGAGLFYCFAID